MISDFYREVAGREIDTGMVIAHQTFGDMLRYAIEKFEEKKRQMYLKGEV